MSVLHCADYFKLLSSDPVITLTFPGVFFWLRCSAISEKDLSLERKANRFGFLCKTIFSFAFFVWEEKEGGGCGWGGGDGEIEPTKAGRIVGTKKKRMIAEGDKNRSDGH